MTNLFLHFFMTLVHQREKLKERMLNSWLPLSSYDIMTTGLISVQLRCYFSSKRLSMICLFSCSCAQVADMLGVKALNAGLFVVSVSHYPLITENAFREFIEIIVESGAFFMHVFF